MCGQAFVLGAAPTVTPVAETFGSCGGDRAFMLRDSAFALSTGSTTAEMFDSDQVPLGASLRRRNEPRQITSAEEFAAGFPRAHIPLRCEA